MDPTHHRVFFLVPPEVQLLDMAGPAHVFYEAAAYGAAITPYYITLQAAPEVASSAGLVLSNLSPYATHTLEPNDILFIPGLESNHF